MRLQELGMNKRTLSALNRKKINTVTELVTYFPRKYLDYRYVLPLNLAAGKDCAICGYLESYQNDLSSGRSIVKAHIIEESTGEKVTVSWFGQPYQLQTLKECWKKEIVVCGKVKKHEKYGYVISNPQEYCRKEMYHGHIVPVYRKIKGVAEDTLCTQIDKCIETVSDPLDARVVKLTKLPEYTDSLRMIHHPDKPEDVEMARKRIIFDDMLYFTIRLKERDQSLPAVSNILVKKTDITKNVIESFPYIMTEDQRSAYEKIKFAMMSGKRVNILIQGDVSCGKTTVAILSVFLMAENGYQSALMAPTLVLAKQHYEEIKNIAGKFGYKTVALTKEVTGKERKKALSIIENGEADIIVGTQSLFSENTKYKRLGLVITDEEHRFGVVQRKKMEEKALDGVHIITMSATPIPRSVADAIYGETKDIVNILSMPAGRKKVQTAINNSQGRIMEFMEKQLASGRQAYVVCPLIENGEKEEVLSVEDALIVYRGYFSPKGYKVAAVTGKTSPDELAAIMDEFKKNNIQILIATTVIEVGVNVPNANVIVINNAEYFGLAQLHQLRGRICRGSYQPYCILKSSHRENKRLQTMVETTDGFVIAQRDIELRGMGDLLGTDQSGNNHYMDQVRAMPNLYNSVKKYADMLMDYDMCEQLIRSYEETGNEV